MVSFKQGALIAIAAGSLFAAACKKSESPKPEMKGDTKGEMKGEMAKPDDKGMGMAKPDDKAMANEKMAKIRCGSVNACKGHGGCQSEANACKGHNECKGKSFVELTEEECKAKGGVVLAAKK